MAIPAYYSLLQRGSSGPDVALVQTWLNGVRDACTWYSELKADGKFGISTENAVSQPAPLSGGKTRAVQNSEIMIQADKGPIVRMPKSSSLRDVVRALNAVGATPQDLLAILQAMKAAGSLNAELEII